jgi:hypothetical protein
VNVAIKPDPTEEERRAILAALATVTAGQAAYASRWRASALELSDGALAEEGRSDAGVIEP